MAADQEDFQTLLITGPSQEPAVSVQGTLASVAYMDKPFRAPTDFVNKSSVVGYTLLNTAPISWLGPQERLAQDFIKSVPQGQKEFFAAQAGLR